MHSFTGDNPIAAQQSVMEDRRELALVAVERTRMPMVVTDPAQPDAPIVLANKAFLELTGYAADEVLGRNCRFLQGPGTAPEAVEAIRQGLAAGEHFVTVELLNYCKDGSTFWNQLEISPVHDEAGKTVYYFASQKDVTARRRAQELAAIERLLLMEVDHRSMNALAMVQSILSLTRANDVAGYSTAVRRRVDSMARVHRILSISNWDRTPLEELIKAELPEGRVRLRGVPIKLSARVAQPVAVALHELISNAHQHGALVHPEGEVEVCWSLNNNVINVAWQEAGGPPFTSNPEPGTRIGIVPCSADCRKTARRGSHYRLERARIARGHGDTDQTTRC